MNVAAQQSAEIPGVLAGSAASAFMCEEFDAINVGKEFVPRRLARVLNNRVILELLRFTLARQPD